MSIESEALENAILLSTCHKIVSSLHIDNIKYAIDEYTMLIKSGERRGLIAESQRLAYAQVKLDQLKCTQLKMYIELHDNLMQIRQAQAEVEYLKDEIAKQN